MSNGNSSRRAAKARLWVITEPYYPEDTSTGYYLTCIAEGLAEDFDVKVICGQPNYSKRGTVAPVVERHRGVEIHRAAGTTLDKNVVVFRLINMLTHGVSVLVKAVRRLQPGDRVLVVTTPPSLPFITAAAALIRGASYTLLIHDNYPEILVAANKTRRDSLLCRTIDFFNRWLYKYAARIIVVGRDMKELLQSKTAGLDVPIAVIPNWAELETVEPRPREENELLKELGIEDKFVFLYAGNMGHPNDLESIVACAEALRDTPGIHFVFLGSGVKQPWLAKAIASRGLVNVSLLPPRPRSEQAIFLNGCDVAVVSLVRRMRGVSMPSRTYNALAAGKPILALAEDGSEVARVIEEEGVGWVVAPGKTAELTALVREIAAAAPETLEEMSRRARRAAVKTYAPDTALGAYQRELLRAADDVVGISASMVVGGR